MCVCVCFYVSLCARVVCAAIKYFKQHEAAIEKEEEELHKDQGSESELQVRVCVSVCPLPVCVPYPPARTPSSRKRA